MATITDNACICVECLRALSQARPSKRVGHPEDKAHITAENYSPVEMSLLIASGVELEALCGYRRVPNPQHGNLPLCEQCVRLHDATPVHDPFDGSIEPVDG